MQTSDSLDRPLRDLRISVTDRCNFRCPYCMPAEMFGEKYTFLPKKEILSFEETERVARLCVELGARKLRITGGEPLLRAELPLLISRLARLPGVEDLALTTNGHLLARHARALAEAGLGRITLSLDSLDDGTFRHMNGLRQPLDRVLEGIEAAERFELTPLKINCVVIRDVNEDSILGLARRFQGTGHVIRFVEFMDVGTLNGWELAKVVPAREIIARIHAELPLEPAEPNYAGEVARRYRYRDGSGEIGVIASVTQPFCGECTRARLSADGRLVTCLFATDGTDLRSPLRAGASDDEMREILRGVWARRADRYSEERTSHTAFEEPARLEMHRLGG